MKKVNSTRQINRAYQSSLKALIKGQHEKEIFDSLSAGKNSYLRLDRLASSSFDKSWIEIIEGVIFDLGDIIANPRQNTKTEGVVTPIELAKKITGESVQHLASHTQYIKEVDDYGNVIPSKLLSMYNDDDIHTYENRFIATFVRRLMLFITKRYEYITQFAELRNEEVLYFKNKSVVDGMDVEIETKVKVSYKNEDENAMRNSNYVERIKETRQYILYFYNSPFMKAMKTERDVRNPIVQTNIIRKNPKYHHCYEVYHFIETYDRLGVNYKIDENYSLFNQEELNELNRTLFANYITLKGNNESKLSKKNTKIYKPRILTSLDDESFIYGPLLEGPISFVRVDDGYQAYLDSKIRKDLPLHPTKKEKEYYEDEYAQKAENKQDLKQKNDLLKRKEKEVNAFEKSVKKILAKREEARLKLIEEEKAAIKKEEDDLLENARRAIVEASKQDQENNTPKEVETPAPEEKKAYVPTVSFIEAADQIWPQLNHPTPLPVKEEKPLATVQHVQPVPVPTPVKEVASEAKPEPQPAKVVKVYVPTVSFNDAANEIWPQLNHPTPIAKPVEEEKVKEQPAPIKKEEPVKKVIEPVKETKEEAAPEKVEKVYVPTVSFQDAADEIWAQLNNPRPLPKEEAKPAPANEPIKKEAKPAGKPIKKHFMRSDGTVAIIYKIDKKSKTVKPQEKKEAPKVEKEAPKAEKKEPKPAGKPIKKHFMRSDGTVAIIYKKKK